MSRVADNEGSAMRTSPWVYLLIALASAPSLAQQLPLPPARDPGARAGGIGAGQPLPGLSADELIFFTNGLARFNQADSVRGGLPGEAGLGLGPTYNSNSCGSCHAQPSAGGSSPSANVYPRVGPNPQIAVATLRGAKNAVPSFLTPDGPVREVRFPYLLNADGTLSQNADGGVHALFTIAGRGDAGACDLPQTDFARMQQLGNVSFRIPTPVYGAGLIENISDATILANMAANATLKQQLGIGGHTNTNGNDGSITRFGWKAQNKSLQIFSGEAYNVEMGVTNELFPNERANPPASCLLNPTPEDLTNFALASAEVPSDTVAFSDYMRFLAPPAPSTQGVPGNPPPQSFQNGQGVFARVHCDTCHTPTLQTATSIYTPGLSNQNAALYSDLLVHNMGSGLSDRIAQGAAGPADFRTAPLWGVGQRIFFLHDGRAGPANGGLLAAIRAHASPGSEANAVVAQFNSLGNKDQQDLLNFLRSL